MQNPTDQAEASILVSRATLLSIGKHFKAELELQVLQYSVYPSTLICLFPSCDDVLVTGSKRSVPAKPRSTIHATGVHFISFLLLLKRRISNIF
jgi:hypothetical protein